MIVSQKYEFKCNIAITNTFHLLNYRNLSSKYLIDKIKLVLRSYKTVYVANYILTFTE